MKPTTKQHTEQQTLLQWLPGLRRFVAGKVRQPEVVDDVVQETLTRTYQSTDPTALINPLAYLTAVANSVLAEYWRRNRVEQRDFDEENTRDTTPSLESSYVSKRHLHAMLSVLEAMPPLRQRVFILRRVHGMTRQEIALKLNLKEEAVKKHITRAMLDVTLAAQAQGWRDE